jgi:hypothetical protein
VQNLVSVAVIPAALVLVRQHFIGVLDLFEDRVCFLKSVLVFICNGRAPRSGIRAFGLV